MRRQCIAYPTDTVTAHVDASGVLAVRLGSGHRFSVAWWQQSGGRCWFQGRYVHDDRCERPIFDARNLHGYGDDSSDKRRVSTRDEDCSEPPPSSASSGGSHRFGRVSHASAGGPSANLAGAYTLTLTAASACTSLPDEARTRTYAATIVPGSRPNNFIGTLRDARIVSVHPWFPNLTIGVADDFVNVSLGFVEQMSDGTYLAIEGGTAASVGQSGITAPFNAHFVRCRNQPAWAPGEYWWCGADVQGDECASSNNQLTLVRR